MKKIVKTFQFVGLASIIIALTCAVVACSPVSGEQVEEQAANRAYMSSVNQVMETIKEDLSGFGEALSSEDVVSMKTQAEKTSEAIAELEKLEAPEGLKEIHEGYVTGTKKLQEALSSYIDVYAKANDGGNVDKQLKSIQKLYDEGVQALEDADKKAAEQE